MKSTRSVFGVCVSVLVMASFVLLIDLVPAQAQDEDTPTPDEIENMADPGGLPSADSADMNSADMDAPVRKTIKKKANSKKSVKVKAKTKPQRKVKKTKNTDDEELDIENEPPPKKSKAVSKPKPAPLAEPPVEKPVDKSDEQAEVEVVPPSPEPTETANASPAATPGPLSDEERAASAFEDEKLLKTQRAPMVPEPLDVKSPEKVVSNDLAFRTVAVPPIAVAKTARKFIAKDFEKKLRDRILLDIKTLTYVQPTLAAEPLKGGMLSSERPNKVIGAYIKKAAVDGLLYVQLGLEEINTTIVSKSGRLIRTFQVKYRVAELDEKDPEIVLSQRVVDAFVLSVSYKGYVIKTDKGGALAHLNLGSAHGIKVGDLLGLFEYRGSTLQSTRRSLLNVEVKEIVGPSECIVVPEKAAKFGGRDRIPPVAFVSYDKPKTISVSAEDKSIVSGRWWVSAGASVESYGAEAAAPKYESRVFKVNSTPFGTFGFGNDDITAHAGFGSAASSSETLRFFDVQATYALYQYGASQTAFIVSGGGRLLMIDVVPVPGAISALSSTNVLSPMAELRYQYVPRGRVRLIGIGEVFWPIWSTGADLGSLIFAFGGGVGGSLQLALTERFGLEVFGKARFLRRTIDGMSGVQERQSSMGAGLIFSF